jgi:hypothetical protein
MKKLVAQQRQWWVSTPFDCKTLPIQFIQLAQLA